MPDIKVAFWNLENLFDVVPNEVFSDFEFTPANGWDQAAFDAKLANLASVIQKMHNGAGPDLLGVAEIENEGVAKKLLAAIGLPQLKLAPYQDAPDIRGIDVALFFSTNVFKAPPEFTKGHVVHLRYPTRDIFEAHLELKGGGGELLVYVNHWPSRRLGQYESEPARITVAERCGQLIDARLKMGRSRFLGPPKPTIQQLNDLWNHNVLVLGDFNDQPHDPSILDYLQGSKDLDHLEEVIKPAAGGALPEAKTYLGKRAYLFNWMWRLLATPDQGTLHFGPATNSMNLLDQFMVSRGLYYGEQKLKIDPASASIFKALE
ncbi:MAG TPA: endonuclease/exonuclease/phosphatase family protein [Candidatus Eisenbacteria bacterium]|jgi:hypothetical protein